MVEGAITLTLMVSDLRPWPQAAQHDGGHRELRCGDLAEDPRPISLGFEASPLGLPPQETQEAQRPVKTLRPWAQACEDLGPGTGSPAWGVPALWPV